MLLLSESDRLAKPPVTDHVVFSTAVFGWYRIWRGASRPKRALACGSRGCLSARLVINEAMHRAVVDGNWAARCLASNNFFSTRCRLVFAPSPEGPPTAGPGSCTLHLLYPKPTTANVAAEVVRVLGDSGGAKAEPSAIRIIFLCFGSVSSQAGRASQLHPAACVLKSDAPQTPLLPQEWGNRSKVWHTKAPVGFG